MKNPEHQTLLYVKIFIAIILVAALVSAVVRVIILVQNSTFVGSSFNALLIGRDAYIVHIDASDKKVLTIKLSGARKELIGKSQIMNSADLGVLIDGWADIGKDTSYSNPGDLLFKFYKYHNMNDFDILKMVFYNALAADNNKSFKQYNFNSKKIHVLGSQDGMIKMFGDRQLLSEEKSIAVINSSDINGLAASVGTALKSVGFNVVDYGSEDGKKSQIQTDDVTSASVGRLSHALRIPVKEGSQSSVADITVIIGSDLLK